MSIRSKLRLLFSLFFLFFLSNSYAYEVWVKDLSTERFYLSIEQTEIGYKLHHYHQVKGDYPDHLEEKFFKEVNLIAPFVTDNYSSYVQMEKLSIWPIEPVSLFIHGEKQNAVLWEVTESWNDEWEARYSKWLQDEIKPDFYHKYNIATDCADALIGLRWIFARMHSLPVANTLADTADLFGHYSMRRIWLNLPTAKEWYEDQLFLTALEYVMDLASTRTVNLDGYPVKISKEGMVPGTFIVTQSTNSGHVKFISENHYSEEFELPLYTLSSTSPRDLRLLTREVFVDQDWPERGRKEILAFRWPVMREGKWVLMEPSEHKNYSEEQYDLSLKENYPAFINFVVARLKNNYDPIKLVEIAVNDILDSVKRRILIVDKGYEFCKNQDCAPGTIGHEDWATPSRDNQLKAKFETIDKLVRDFLFMAPTLQSQWVDGLRQTKFKLLGKDTDLSVIRFLVDNNLLSSDPSEQPEKRWGFNKDEHARKWIDEANALFAQRNSIIEKTDEPCKSTECFPKNMQWLELNTYHVDTELNRLYVRAISYCALVDKSACDLLKQKGRRLSRTFNKTQKSFEDWFYSIPQFHSDPRVSKARRWGEIEDGTIARVLPYHNTIKIAENNLALIDGRKIYNLLDGSLITETKDDNRIFLSDSGSAYKINDTTGELKRLSWSQDGVGLWRRVSDKTNILQKDKIRKLVFVDEKKTFFFKKPTSEGQIYFTVKDDVVEIITKSKGASSLNQGLLSVVKDPETIVYYDFNKGLRKEVSINRNVLKDLESLKISSYHYPNVVLEYRDRDNDLYYPVTLNLENSRFEKLDALNGEKVLVLWSSAKQKKAFIQKNFNREHPELFAIRWDEKNDVEVAPLANLLLGASEDEDKIYFINARGGQWDQNPAKEFMVWDQEDIKSIIAPDDSEVRFFSSVGPYFSSPEKGFLLSFETQKNFRLPKDVLEKNQLCDLHKNAEKIFVYRFSTNYGDYSCMGGGFSIFKKTLDDEVIPDFSLYSWINNESLNDQRWQKDFSNFQIKSGTLIALGKNLSLWWKPNKR